MLLLLHHFNGANIRPFANGANIFCKKLTFLFKLFFSRLFFRCLQKKYRNYISAFFRILFYINYNKLLIASTYVCFGATPTWRPTTRSEEHTSELQSRENLVCRLLLEKKKQNNTQF